MMGRKQTTGEGVCWGWELLLITVTGSVSLNQLVPKFLLITAAMVVFIHKLHCQDWEVYYSFLFCLCFTIHSSHLEESIQEAIAEPIIICHPQTCVCFLAASSLPAWKNSVALALPAILLFFKLCNRFQPGPRTCMLEFFLPMLPFFPKLAEVKEMWGMSALVFKSPVM